MSTKFIDLHGKVKYIHAVNLGKYGSWTVDIWPDESSLKVIHELKDKGLKNHLKKDEDGQYHMQFKRDPQKMMKGRMVAFTQPKCVDKDEKVMDGTKIGWGSDVTIRLAVYDYGGRGGIAKGCAARWEAIKVNNLVEFEMDKSDWSDAEKASVTNIEEPAPW